MLTAVNTNFHDSSSFPFLMPDEITNKIWNGSEISSVFSGSDKIIESITLCKIAADLESDSQVRSQTFCVNGRAYEQMKILVTSDSDTWLPSADEYRIAHIFFNHFASPACLCIQMIFPAYFVYPSGSSVQVAVNGECFAPSQMPVSAETYPRTDRINVTGRIVSVCFSLTHKDGK